MEDDTLLEHVSKYLRETLVASSLLLSKMQKLKEAASQDTLQIKELTRRETGRILEMAELRKFDQETKKLLFQKSQETLRIYARNTDLRDEVNDLVEKLGSRDAEVVQLEEESTQLKVKLTQLEEQLAKMREELVRKDEHFLQTKDELTCNAVESYAAGFEDALAQVACVHPGVDLSQTGLTKTIVNGKLVDPD